MSLGSRHLLHEPQQSGGTGTDYTGRGGGPIEMGRSNASRVAGGTRSAEKDGKRGPGGGGYELDSYDPQLGFWLLTPQIQTTNVLLTLENADTNISYDIYYTPVISTNMSWSILATGSMGQINFTVPMIGDQSYYRGAVGAIGMATGY